MVWTGVAGLPAYSNFYFLNGAIEQQEAHNAVGSLMGSLQNFVRTGVTMTVEGSVPTIDSATGNILSEEELVTDTFNGADPTEPLPPAVQLLVRYRTQAFSNGRRVQGRTYLPCMTQTVNDSGKVGEAQRTAISGYFSSFFTATANGLVVWAKTSGGVAPVSSISIWDQFAVMRSRRD